MKNKQTQFVHQKMVIRNDFGPCLLQLILEKFEFFPIKCRVQRSLENFNAKQNEQTSLSPSKTFKLKVHHLFRSVLYFFTT
jgi:hypothetical protein